jgi:hypothetical protein
MQGMTRTGLWLCGCLCLLTGFTWSALPRLGKIEVAKYQMTPIANHTPWGFKSSDKYWNSMQHINLKVGNLKQFTNLPDLGMKNPYTGYIVLGDQNQKFGFIVDIYGEEKRLYIDTDGDGSFAREKYTVLLNEWYGAQLYWVMAPEPILLNVRYRSWLGQANPVEISVLGYIFKPGLLGKQQPFLLVEVRTWFLAKLKEDGVTKLAAVVDQNQNGRYDDPQDMLFIDYNNNGFFSKNEGIQRKNGIKLSGAKQKLSFDWSSYPDVLKVEEGN